MGEIKNFSHFVKWFSLVVILTALNVSNPGRLLSIFQIIALVPAIYISIGIFGSESRGFSPIILVSIYFGASFAVGSYIFSSFQTYSSADTLLIFKMSSISVLGIYSTVLGAYFSRSLVSRAKNRNYQKSTQNVRLPIFLLLFIGWFARLSVIRSGRYFHLSDTDLVQTTTQTSFIMNTLTILPTICLGLCVAGFLKGLFTSRLKIGIIFGTDLIYHFLSGSRQSLLVPIIAFGFAWLNNGGKLPRLRFLSQVFIGISAILTLAFIAEYRVVRYQGDRTPITALVEASNHFFKDGIVKQIGASFLTVFERASDVISMALAYSLPRSELQSIIHNPFALIPSTLVPRVLLPNKVDLGLVGNKFGRAIGLLNPGDYFTSIDFPLPLEGYLWRGILGVILVCGFSGVIYYSIHVFVFSNRNDLKDSLYGATLLSLFNSPAQILALGIFGWLKSAFFLYIILLALNRLGSILHKEGSEIT
jgi:hypothetical protein